MTVVLTSGKSCATFSAVILGCLVAVVVELMFATGTLARGKRVKVMVGEGGKGDWKTQ
jgi:hypothetical protein